MEVHGVGQEPRPLHGKINKALRFGGSSSHHGTPLPTRRGFPSQTKLPVDTIDVSVPVSIQNGMRDRRSRPSRTGAMVSLQGGVVCYTAKHKERIAEYPSTQSSVWKTTSQSVRSVQSTSPTSLKVRGLLLKVPLKGDECFSK